jgi:hypothetical protein
MERTSSQLRRAIFEAGDGGGEGGADGGRAPRGRFAAETQLVQGLQQPRRTAVLKAPDGKELVDNKMPLGADGQPLTVAYVACAALLIE